MSYDRPLSPPRSAWDPVDSSYPSGRSTSRGDEHGADEGYGRRGIDARSPRDDDRRKRRRSPSPRPNDTYVPAYGRERSPNGARGGRGPGGPADFHPSQSYSAGDRHNGRDGFDASGPSGGYDRRASAPGGSSRGGARPPSELPYLVSFAYFRDWLRDEDPRTYDDRMKLDEAYKKYRLNFLHRNNRQFWDDIKGFAWTKEKYGTSEQDASERKRLRETGREGKLDLFLAKLEGGELDEFSYDQKSSPPKAEPRPLEDDRKPEGNGTAEEDVDPKPKEAEAADTGVEQTVTETAENDVKPDIMAADEAKGEGDAVAPLGDDETRKTDEDIVTVPAAPNTLIIKSLSPDIARTDLEAHCKQVDGFDYVALGDPNPLKRFHRIGWIVFKPDADMASAQEKLYESKINDFTLHMSAQDNSSTQRMRAAPSLMNAPDRIRSSLEHVKQIVTGFEAELNDNRGSAAITAKFSQLRDKSDYDAPDGEDDAARVARLDVLDRRFLDIYIQYLRTVFHTCYYCVTTCDFPEELTKKCVGHIRKQQPLGKNGKVNEQAWLKTFDEKIPLLLDRDAVNPAEYGGENYDEEITKLCEPHIQIEDEGKYRCKQCKKLFKAGPFVEKHILNKHGEVVKDQSEEIKFFNNYILDPAKVTMPSQEGSQYSSNPGHPSSGPINRMADTFGAFNQMFNPQFNGYMMGGYAPPGGFYNPVFQPMSASFNGYNGPPGPGYGGPLSGNARALGDRIGERDSYHRSNGGPAKRQRRESNLPPPPPKGARIDPRASKLHAYTDLDGPPAGGGEADIELDY